MELLHSGKVREVYADGEDVILVASDRVSVYDVVLPTPIPGKGKLLTQLSLWWFDQLADIMPHHVISGTDVPAEWAARAVRCQRLNIVQVECIARGYLAGLGLKEYEKYGSVSGVSLPEGLVEGSKLPEPIFTPTTKASGGAHDEFITYDVVDQVGPDLAARLRDLTIRLYSRGAEITARTGIIVADTKFEFGWSTEGELVLGDEVLTSDSSRFWPADEREPGRPQFAFDKQFVRDWAAGTGWDRSTNGSPVARGPRRRRLDGCCPSILRSAPARGDRADHLRRGRARAACPCGPGQVASCSRTPCPRRSSRRCGAWLRASPSSRRPRPRQLIGT